MRDIALIGRARSGKDTIGARLVDRFGYTRLAFADPLKEMALEINPIVNTGAYECDGILYTEETRLDTLVHAIGWERSKDLYPEVRRILQHVGQSVRKRDPDYWVKALESKMEKVSGRVVVTDVRYQNEASTLADYGFKLVRVVRPDRRPLSEALSEHDSETELADFPTPLTILNSGTLNDLRAHADSIAL